MKVLGYLGLWVWSLLMYSNQLYFSQFKARKWFNKVISEGSSYFVFTKEGSTQNKRHFIHTKGDMGGH